MRNILSLLVFSLICLPNVSLANTGGCAACLDGGGSDWLHVTLEGMTRLDSVSGKIVLSFEEYTTAEDPTCGNIDVRITRKDCPDAEVPRTVFNEHPCIWLCGDSLNCKRWGYCDWCGFWSHSYSTWSASYLAFQNGTLEVYYKNRIEFLVPFDFGNNIGSATPKFTSTRFLNKDYSQILRGDVFDAMEAVAISVIAKFDGRPSPYIVVKFVSDISIDTTGMDLPLSQTQGDNYIYSILLPPGFFGDIIGDPGNIPSGGATITAIPREIKCDGTVDPNVPVGQITVADYGLQVAEISFLDDFQLFKDNNMSVIPHVDSIVDPVWITSGSKNDPVAYRRDSTYDMSITVKCDHFPMHDFAYKIRAVCQGDQHIARYSTGEYLGHIAYGDKGAITGIRPAQNGQFPDYVGSDSLVFIWSVNKSFQYGIDNYRRLNITGPHKVYCTFEKPLIDSVNVIGLDKICSYAQGLNIDTLIAGSGVSGVYGEGWNYDPGDPFSKDPLKVIRKHTGQCVDYANLLVYLYNAIGISSHGVVIFDAAQTGSNLYYLLWYNTATNNPYANVWSNWLTACDGQSKNWDFTYHAVAYCADHFCDASLGLFKPEDGYTNWWKYYVYPQDTLGSYLDAEPPPVPPHYYHHNLYVLPPIYPPNLLPWAWDTHHSH